MQITTKSGFTCEVDKEKLDDWYFARLASKAAAGGADALECTIYLVDNMLSKKDAERLEKHVKLKDGRVPTSKIITEITEIMSAAGKN